MMNDSYPKDHPGCLSKAREVLRQAMRDTDVQSVTFLEFQEEVTQVLGICTVCQQRMAGAVTHTYNVTCCRLWLCIFALLLVANCDALHPLPCSFVVHYSTPWACRWAALATPLSLCTR